MDDHLLLAAEEPEIAVLVGAGEVARVEPVVDHHLRGRLRRLPVADHAAAGCGSRSGPPPRPRSARPRSSRSAIAKPLIGLPDRALPDLAGGRVERRQPDLGHPVALDDREAGRRGELGQQLGRDLVGAGPADPQRGEVAGLQVVVVDQRRERRRDHRQHRRLAARAAAAAARGRRCCARRRPCRRPRASPAPRGRSRCGTSRSRAGRRRRRSSSNAAAALAIIQRRVSRVWVTPLAGPVLPEVKKITAGISGSSGVSAGRAGSESSERGEVVAQPPSAAAGSSLPAAAARRRGRRSSRARRPPASSLGGDVLGPLDVGEQDAGAAHLQRVIDLGGRVAVVQRRRDQPRPEAGEVVDDEVDPVRHQRGDPIARLEAEPAVAAGQRRARPVELAPGQRPAGRGDRDLVRRRVEADLQQVVERPGRALRAGRLRATYGAVSPR